MSTKAENLDKIGPVLAEIFGGICSFLPCRSKKLTVVTLVISGFTGPIFIKFRKNVAKILPLNIIKSELLYSNPFRDASLLNEGHFANFAPKLVAISTTLKEQEAFEKCLAHSPLRAAARPNFALPFTRFRYCRTPPLSHAD